MSGITRCSNVLDTLFSQDLHQYIGLVSLLGCLKFDQLSLSNTQDYLNILNQPIQIENKHLDLESDVLLDVQFDNFEHSSLIKVIK